MNRDTYRQSLAALLTAADRLGSTPDDLAARAVVLAELRHAIAAGLVEEPAPVEQPKQPRGRLVWVPAVEQWLLGPPGCNAQSAYYIACDCDVSRYPGGRPTPDKVEWCQGLPNALRRAAEWARADGYECDDHPDAAPAEQPPERPTPSDDDDWTPWSGGDCPCPDWPEVEYKCRDGYSDTQPPAKLSWMHCNDIDDIIAYRRPRP